MLLMTRNTQQLCEGSLDIYCIPSKEVLSDEPLAVPLDEIHIDDKLHFVEEPVEILDRRAEVQAKSLFPSSKFNGTPREVLSSHGNAKISSGTSIRTSSKNHTSKYVGILIVEALGQGGGGTL
ncbi:hypothetical protein Tco_0847114 [Tanacetum coccineum]